MVGRLSHSLLSTSRIPFVCLSAFSAVTVNTANFPTAPTAIFLGSPISNSSSSPVTISLCVQAYSDANACAVAQASPSFYGMISIPSGATACSGGGHPFGIPNSKGKTANGQSTDLEQSVSVNSIFPNPATNSININFEGVAKHTVEIVSVTGSLYKRVQDNGSNRLNINVSRLPRAVYFALIYEDKQVVSRQKIVLL